MLQVSAYEAKKWAMTCWATATRPESNSRPRHGKATGRGGKSEVTSVPDQAPAQSEDRRVATGADSDEPIPLGAKAPDGTTCAWLSNLGKLRFSHMENSSSKFNKVTFLVSKPGRVGGTELSKVLGTRMIRFLTV